MPSVNVIDLNNATVGSIELSDVVFGAEVNEALLYEAVRQYTADNARGRRPPKRAMKSVVRVRNCGSRREPGVLVWVPFGRRCGVMAVPPTVRNRVLTNTVCLAR